MDGIESSITEQSSDADTRLIALEIINQIQDLIFGLLRPCNAYQIAIAIFLFLVATLLSSALKKRLRSLMEVRDGWPIWRMRFMVVFEERLRLQGRQGSSMESLKLGKLLNIPAANVLIGQVM